MSMATWHLYGYGIDTSRINTSDKKFKAFIDSQPSVKAEVLKWEEQCIKDNDLNSTAEEEYKNDDITTLCNLYEDYADCNVADGFSDIIAKVLSAATGLEFLACKDSTTETCYVVLQSCYPWEMNDAMRKLKSEDNLKAIFTKNLKPLTKQTLTELDYDYQEVEGWG